MCILARAPVAATTLLCSDHLSSLYFTGVKDRLYCAAPDDPDRRAAQAVLNDTLQVLVRAIAPILPFLAEEVFEHRQAAWAEERDGVASALPLSPILSGWQTPPASWTDDALAARWRLALACKSEVKRAHYVGQANKLLAVPADTRALLHATGAMHVALSELGNELNDVLGVSATALVDSVACDGHDETREVAAEAIVDDAGLQHTLKIVLQPSDAPKCPRCWRHVSPALVGRGEGVEADGWLHRGCICPSHHEA